LMLPDMPGETILSYLSQRPDYPAVLVLSARGQTSDKIQLFRKGCDDYLTKPFIFEELLVRVQSLMRRPPRIRTSDFNYRGLSLDVATNQISASGQSVMLTPKETAMCRVFIGQSEQIISRKEILQSVWGLREEPSANYIGIHLFKLRKKFEQIERGGWLQTVRSTGFVLCDTSVREYGD
jgi:two-component system OmpR family response regulator